MGVLIASVCAEPESEAKADAKPWLAYSNYGYAGYPYAAGYAAYPYAGVYGAGYNGYATGYHYLGKRSADSESDAKPWLTYANYGYHTLPPMVLMLVPMPQLSMVPVMPLTPPHTPPMVLLTSSAREKLKLTLKPSHGWPTPTTDMLDTHTLPPMVPMLTHLSTEPLMPLQLTPPMVLLTSSARDLLTPNQKPCMELTDTLPHTPMVDTDHTDTLLTVHTPTDVYMVPTTDTIEHVEKY